MKIVEEPIVDYKTTIRVVSSEYISDYKIQLIFNDGQKSVIDFEKFLSSSQHPSIRLYLDTEKFKQFKIVNGNLNWNDYELIFPLSDLRNGQIS